MHHSQLVQTRKAVPLFKKRQSQLKKTRQLNERFSIAVSIVLGIGCMIVCVAGLYEASFPLSPGRLLSNMGASADPLFQQAMLGYSGVRKAPADILTTDDGLTLTLAETFSWEEYTVRRGDTISQIALDHGLSMDSIIALNGVHNVRRLMAGDIIRIPNMDGIPYKVGKGDSLSRISSSYGIPVEVILDANDLATDVLSVGMSLFLPGARMSSTDLRLALGELIIYPIRGRLTSGYGWRNDPFTGARRYHAAIDLAAATGTAIKVAMDGTIVATGTSPTYGNYIIVSHDSGFQTLYAHLSAFSTSKGRRVTQGQKIGEVGSTGYSTGPHLHFALYRNGRALNPLQYLAK